MHDNCVKRQQVVISKLPHPPTVVCKQCWHDIFFSTELDKVSIVDLYIDIFLSKLPLNNGVHATALPQNSTKKQFLNFLIYLTLTLTAALCHSHIFNPTQAATDVVCLNQGRSFGPAKNQGQVTAKAVQKAKDMGLRDERPTCTWFWTRRKRHTRMTVLYTRTSRR